MAKRVSDMTDKELLSCITSAVFRGVLVANFFGAVMLGILLAFLAAVR